MKQNKRFKAAPNKESWFNFNLCQGHIFGIMDGVPYVSAAEQGARGTIKVYRCTPTANCFRWGVVYVGVNSDLGKRIMEAKRESPFDTVRLMPVKGVYRTWPYKLPTYETSRRATRYSPMPPVQRMQKTWVDAICGIA